MAGLPPSGPPETEPELRGACCMGDDCEVLNSVQCSRFGGNYLGHHTTCDPVNPCVIENGACCLPGGNQCVQFPQGICEDTLGGTFRGVGVPCVPDPCLAVGACCDDIGNCSLVTAQACEGLYQGDNVLCEPNPCIGTGACCVGEVCHQDIGPPACLDMGGVYQGDGTACEPNPCLPAQHLLGRPYIETYDRPETTFGRRYLVVDSCGVVLPCTEGGESPAACCFVGGLCLDETINSCLAAGGFPAAASCADIVLCPPVAPCCRCEGVCRITSSDCCQSEGGKWHPDKTDCDQVQCIPFGACCADEIGCTEGLTHEECMAAFGVYYGDCTDCANFLDTCPPTTGACCVLLPGNDGGPPSWQCVEPAGERNCYQNLGGYYTGDNVGCSPGVCDEIVGACCCAGAADTCQDLALMDCLAVNGVWQEPGVACADGPCGGIDCGTVACCYDTYCIDTSEAACATTGGWSGGFGSACDPPDLAVCGKHICCFEDGLDCFYLHIGDCLAQGGSPLGGPPVDPEYEDPYGAPCSEQDQNSCPDGLGACCIPIVQQPEPPYGWIWDCIQVAGPESCAEHADSIFKLGEACFSNDQSPICIEHYETCCLPHGQCTYTSTQESPTCTEQGGAGIGALVPCDQVDCSDTVQACCLPGAECVDASWISCTAAGGLPQGLGTTCATTVCEEDEACCTQFGCHEAPPADCIADGGTPQGFGTTCIGTTCPTDGACCFQAACVDGIQYFDCANANGVFMGVGTTCAGIGTCPMPQACCYTSGPSVQCSDQWPGDCMGPSFNGIPQGEGVMCASDPCVEACCDFGECVGTMTCEACELGFMGWSCGGLGTTCPGFVCP